MSVSTAPGKTLKTLTCRLAKSARSDWVSDHAAALEALYTPRPGMLARATSVRMLTTAPRFSVSVGANALVTFSRPKKLTSKFAVERRRRCVEHTAEVEDAGVVEQNLHIPGLVQRRGRLDRRW